MKLSSDFAGLELKEYHTDVTWRRTMNYAAAVNDNNPLYFDDEREDGIVAPPMFTVAVTWPICERIWEYIQADTFPRALLVNLVHYTEHLTFHRIMRPGDRLTVRGRISAILPHRAGTLMIVRLAGVDETGAPVFTEHLGGLLRGVQCDGEANVAEPLPVIPASPANAAPFWEKSVFVDPLAPFIYDGCTNIFFPIHTSVAFARGVGLPDIILQGTATLAYAVRDLTNYEADGNPLLLRSVAGCFTGMVLPGTQLQVALVGRTSDDCGTDLFFVVRNAQGDKVVSDGYARIQQN
ncbi:acyl dehydratase [Desulfomonile tiedjei DSM 6799]|uniref:Acyl dehydratase n=1 Tax=Desulfomonile tiedjei (strain ATCC 49306 / DSM 6799 / DCB-1) TaxID=706587 RepID=I4C346_DESTA|nr:acyl dehydratase [Desulfomonile tiedjei DSM 6799]